MPPNNLPPYYAGVTECQELPTGRYDIHVVHGLAAGLEERDTADPTISQTGHTIHGGSLSGQVWSIPNELGPPDPEGPGSLGQLPADALLAQQGPSARFAVVEPDGGNGVRQGCAPPTEPVAPSCCAAVSHLCDVPLCAPRVDPDGHSVRRPDSSADLPCLPFAMPVTCCP
jgi:hypothetical protein